MNIRKQRILVVDDDPKITRQVRLQLELTGEYLVREENQAPHALAAARDFLPDLILLDIDMPDIPGDVLVNQFRECPKLPGVRVVFLTALATPGDKTPERLLAKPASADDLISCLREELAKGPTRPVEAKTIEDTSPHFSY